jgi:predicted dehydrogenase/nucleoside-diphosphate-sugar epimerase
MRNSKFRVGLVGAGYVCAYHIRALRSLQNVEIAGIADINTDRAQQVAREFAIADVFGSLDEMRCTRPDVIHILTPPDSHCAVSMQAFDMGCHVFVEKPMAPTVEECDRMINRAKQARRVLSVNHSARLDPVVLKAVRMVEQGACGEILAVDFLRSSDYPPYPGGAVPAHYRNGSYPFQDLGVHGLSILEAFLGPIQSADVYPQATGRDPNLFFDEWHALVQCARGMGRIYLSWNVRLPRNEIVIHGTRGILHVDCYLQSCVLRKSLPAPKAVQLFLNAGTSSLSSLTNAARTAIRIATGRLRPNPGIYHSVQEFYRALSADAPLPVPAEEGRRMVYWMEDVSRRADAEKRARLAASAPVRPARILVTGGTGWLGSALVQRLRARGESVRILAHRANAALEEDPQFQVVYGDLGDPDAVERAVKGVEIVYHVGATMRGRCWAEFECGTVRGTQNIVDACLRHQVKRLVYLSSLTVLDYARMKADDRVDECWPIEPRPEQRGLYTQAKTAAEQVVQDAIRDHALPAVILRPGQVFGPGAEKIPPFGTVAFGGRWIVIGSGGLRLPLIYIDDLVDAIEAAGSREAVCGSVFQLVDATKVDQRRYIDFCRMKHSVRVTYAPRPALYGLAVALECVGRVLHRGVPLTRYRIRSIKSPSVFDCSAARELDWTPRVGVETGLKLTFADRTSAPVTAELQPGAAGR